MAIRINCNVFIIIRMMYDITMFMSYHRAFDRREVCLTMVAFTLQKNEFSVNHVYKVKLNLIP